jgi:hypothetical protein
LATKPFVVLGRPLGGEGNTLLIVNASGETETHYTLARGPWTELGVLQASTVHRGTIRLRAPEEAHSCCDGDQSN